MNFQINLRLAIIITALFGFNFLSKPHAQDLSGVWFENSNTVSSVMEIEWRNGRWEGRYTQLGRGHIDSGFEVGEIVLIGNVVNGYFVGAILSKFDSETRRYCRSITSQDMWGELRMRILDGGNRMLGTAETDYIYLNNCRTERRAGEYGIQRISR